MHYGDGHKWGIRLYHAKTTGYYEPAEIPKCNESEMDIRITIMLSGLEPDFGLPLKRGRDTGRRYNHAKRQ